MDSSGVAINSASLVCCTSILLTAALAGRGVGTTRWSFLFCGNHGLLPARYRSADILRSTSSNTPVLSRLYLARHRFHLFLPVVDAANLFLTAMRRNSFFGLIFVLRGFLCTSAHSSAPAWWERRFTAYRTRLVGVIWHLLW